VRIPENFPIPHGVRAQSGGSFSSWWWPPVNQRVGQKCRQREAQTEAATLDRGLANGSMCELPRQWSVLGATDGTVLGPGGHGVEVFR
jgi:hypothetical protein